MVNGRFISIQSETLTGLTRFATLTWHDPWSENTLAQWRIFMRQNNCNYTTLWLTLNCFNYLTFQDVYMHDTINNNITTTNSTKRYKQVYLILEWVTHQYQPSAIIIFILNGFQFDVCESPTRYLALS